MEFIVEEENSVSHLGTVIFLSLRENKLELLTGQLRRYFLHLPIDYKGERYIVKGVETYATPADTPCEKVGLLIKKSNK